MDVERIGVVQDSVETALNSSGDVFFTATAEEFDRKGKGEERAIDNRMKYEENNKRGACALRLYHYSQLYHYL